MGLKKMNILIFISLVNLSSNIAQSYQSYIKSAEKAIEIGNHFGAEKLLAQALQIDSSEMDIIYRYATLCLWNREYHQSIKQYQKVLTKNNMKYTDCYFWLAENYKSIGEYTQAKKFYQQTIDAYNRNKTSYFYKKAIYELKACDVAISIVNTPNETPKMKVKQLKPEINSVYSEFSVQELNDSILYYTTLKPTENDNFVSKLYQAVKKDDEWTKIQEFNNQIVRQDLFEVGNFFYDVGNQAIYFSVKKSDSISFIFKTQKKDDKWQEAQQLPEIINVSGSYTTHPFVTKFKDNDYLFFVSNREGGYGLMDIWFCRILSENSYSNPQNAGKIINSGENEITPFFCISDTTLYFSSQWHYSIGGFDIFKAKGMPGGWQTVENMGFPINSSYDDAYFRHNNLNTKAYFTSNRKEANTIKNEACCNDIFYIDLVLDDTIKRDTNTLITNKQLIPSDTPGIVLIPEPEYFNPINLYFENNFPDPGSWQTTTTQKYSELYKQYVQKSTFYRNQYIRNIAKKHQKKYQQQSTLFFRKLQTEKQKYDSLLVNIQYYLSAGYKIKIEISGYSSPLGANTYNEKLAQRRIESVVNELYNDSIISPFFKNNQLSIEKNSIGESTAPENLSDSFQNIQQSVYSPQACIERRISIKIISIEK